MNRPPRLEAHKLYHRYHDLTVIEELSLRVDAGQTLGLLGPNGAGKSTTLQILSGLLTPDGGTVQINGVPLQQNPQLAKKIGFLPDQAPLYADLSIIEQLRYTARLYGLPASLLEQRIRKAIEQCGLGTVQHQRIAQLSKGFRRRAGLAQALLHEPGILILDEPSDGLDPLQLIAFRDLIRSLQATTAIVISTHNLNEVKTLCSDVIIMNRGRSLYHAAMKDIGQPLEQLFTELIYAGAYA